jgi:acyl-CoA dehydrogenase
VSLPRPLTTGKQAVAVASEALECFGGAGYVEDTGLPRMLADAQALPIWEGTTNVLSLDTLRALAKPAAVEALFTEIGRTIDAGSGPALQPVKDAVDRAMTHAQAFLGSSDRVALEAGARQLALTLGRAYQAALLARHAARVDAAGRDPRRAIAVARRFARRGIDQILEIEPWEVAAAAAVS